jgi:hypothetical protein
LQSNAARDSVLKHTLIYDCEFLTAEGAQSRFWGGPFDPDPIVAQIGVVKLGLEGDFPLLDTLRLYITPSDRSGKPITLDPFFTSLTGITEADIAQHGIPLMQALTATKDFAAGAQLWSWGKDEFNMVAISCYAAGVTPPIAARQFGNACQLMLKAGMPYADLTTTRSNQLVDYYKLDHPPLRAHDALDDALSISYVMQHLLRKNALKPADFNENLQPDPCLASA